MSFRDEILKHLNDDRVEWHEFAVDVEKDPSLSDLDDAALKDVMLKIGFDQQKVWSCWNLFRSERLSGNGNGASASTADVEIETAATQAEIPYPIDVWNGTIYGDFAHDASVENYIPPEFFVEALKTVVGSIVGDRVEADAQGGNMRQYTVLVGSVGKGKGTAARAATKLFSDLENLDGSPTDYLRVIGAQTDYRNVGSVATNIASEVGLYPAAKSCPRVLLVPPEFSELLAKMRIDGSALPATICEMFDTTFLSPSVSAKRAPKDLPSRCMLSMLSTTQVKKLQDNLAAHGGLGEGLVSRITFIQNLEARTVAIMPRLKPGAWFQVLLQKLTRLEAQAERFKIDDDAREMLNDWWQTIMNSVEENEEIITRVNVIVLRNALHLAWIQSDVEIRITGGVELTKKASNRIISKTDMEKAIKLGDYQVALRRTVIVNETANDLASQQQKIKNYLKKHGPTVGRALMTGTNYARVGTTIYYAALKGLIDSGDLVAKATHRKDRKLYALVKYGDE